MPQLETEVKNKLSLEGNGNDNGKLTIRNLELNDTGTYFCAASSQCHTCAVSPLLKPADRLCPQNHYQIEAVMSYDLI